MGLTQEGPTPLAYVIVAGENSAGKSTLAGVLSSELGLPILEFGDLVRREMRDDPALGADPSNAYMALRSLRGPDLLAAWAIPHDQKGLIMVGVRDIESYRVLQDRFVPLYTVAVQAPLSLRLERDRSKSAARGLAQLDRDEFVRRDNLHAAWGLRTIISEANCLVENDSDEGNLRAQALTIASAILQEKT